MASYDSDSSIGEDEDYTETDVLLGYPSEEANGETISRLGGRPVCFFLVFFVFCPLSGLPSLLAVLLTFNGLIL